MPHKRELASCALWVAALFLLSFGTIDTDRLGTPSPFLAWGLFVAVIALVPTGSVIVERMKPDLEDAEVEHIIEVVEALQSSPLRPVR